MEREIILSGVGGQSVQLAAQILARAAVAEGRNVMSLGSYGGTMRGGSTCSTVIVGDAPLVSPPIVSRAWAALVMHHAFWEPTRDKLAPGSLLLVNSPLFEAELDRDAWRVVEVPATPIAAELGQPLAASLVLLGAFVGLSALVAGDALVSAMRDSVPAYRRQHLETNEQALRAGIAWADGQADSASPAWSSGADAR